MTTTLTPPADAPPRPDLDALEQLVREWAGIFDLGTDDDDVDILTFKSRACIDDRCDHLGPCDANVAEFDMAHESIATMLNALPALVAEVRRLTEQLAAVTGERDELVEAATLGPLAGKTMHDTLVELREERDFLSAEQVRLIREREDVRAQYRAAESDLLAGADADALMLTQVGRERDAAVQRAERAESDRLAEVEGLTAERDHYRAALHACVTCSALAGPSGTVT